jgi:hypothetical protein
MGEKRGLRRYKSESNSEATGAKGEIEVDKQKLNTRTKAKKIHVA